MMKRILAVVLCICMVLSVMGCGKDHDAGSTAAGATESQGKQETVTESVGNSAADQKLEAADPFGGYEEPITLSTIAFQTLTQSCPEGVTLEDNPWLDLWAGKGIHVEYSAIAADSEDITTKINLAIASGEIPDYMSVGYSTYKELLEADMIADLTDVFEQYATDDLKSIMYADGGAMAENVTKDGRLYGITQPADYLDRGGVVAIRTDWLQELGLDEPKSMTELWDVAKAFKDNKMGGTCSIGIGATKEISALLPMQYLINAHGGQTSIWLEKDGGLVFGLVQPEMKQALSELHDKYAEGLLDQEYGTKTEQQLYEDAVSGKSGVVIGNFTSPFYLDNGISLGQEWGYFPLYADDGSFAKVEQNVGFSSCVEVSKECEHPEAVIKLFNMFVKYGTEEADTYATDGINNLSYPAVISETVVNPAIYQAYKVFLETGTAPADLPTGYEGTVSSCEKWRLNGDAEGRTLYCIFGPDSTEAAIAEEIEGRGYLLSAFTGTAGDAAVKYSGNLGSMANQMIANIITGAKDVDYFDEFVELWNSNGGAEITKEVNEWYQER